MDSSSYAPRFSLKLPMRYRPEGDLQWRDTTTANVSSSGVLFAAIEPLAPGCRLEVEILMCAELLTPSRIVATSEVIRQKRDDSELMTAVHHLHYEMKAGPVMPGHRPSQPN